MFCFLDMGNLNATERDFFQPEIPSISGLNNFGTYQCYSQKHNYLFYVNLNCDFH
jgi:hypothetical protein